MKPNVPLPDSEDGLRPEVMSRILASQGELGLLIYVLDKADGIFDRLGARGSGNDDQLMTDLWLLDPNYDLKVIALKKASLWLAGWIKETTRPLADGKLRS